MDDDLPYRVEYAKSDRSKCQSCKQSINKMSLRLAVVVQSPVHDGKIPKWYHFNCFFLKQKPKSSADIACFDEIRYEDQEKIQKKIEECLSAPLAKPEKGKKRAKASVSGSGDFRVEYAKSNKSTCRGCDEKITKGEARISKKDYESDEGRRFGGMDRWYHVECFVKLRADLGYYGSGDELPGIKELSKEDRENLKTVLPKMSQADIPPPSKKIKEEPEDAEEAKLIKKQNEELYSIRDQVSRLGKKDLITILERNHQEIPIGESNILNLLADVMYFGALEPCPKCKGQLIYNSGLGYKCTGNVTEWAKCDYITQDPKRKKCEIPSDMKKDFPVRSYKSKVKKRLFKITAPSSSSFVKKEDEVDGPKVKGKPRPLKNMQFVILGRTQRDKEELKKEILSLGGTVITKIHADLAAVISNQDELDKMNKRMEDVKSHDIQVITEDFIEEAKEYTDAPIGLLKKKAISSWGGDINARLANVIAKSGASKSKSRYEKSSSGKMKVKVKGGGAVDPDSGLDHCAHIYQKGKDKYTTTLGLTDIQLKKNSFYKLQILKHDKYDRYYLFRSWGRIGTTIGGHKIEELSLEECIEQFESLYENKSGNKWKNREHFVKVPGFMFPIDIDHGDEEIASLDSDIKSNLQKPIQDLMRLIFDVVEMKKVMLEFEIDMDKMPLGKLSKKQIDKAYAVLTELQEILKKSSVDRMTLIDASNRFYTLIPHNFGISGPKILETTEEIKNKCDMLDALFEMEIAYNLLRDKTDEKENPLDSHYKQLKTDIEVLDKESDEFKMIEQYVKNTHAATHTQYDLEIEEVFIVKRQGEEQRFKPFKKLPNRKLLWHGSRTTNFAGILSQGLRIAPPEAPVTGYMFGKGIYFADMVSKSANYCCTHSQNPTGLLPQRLEKVKFGIPLDEVCKNDIPGPLLVLILILNKEAPFVKNIFRAPGHQGNVKKLIHILQTGQLVNMDNFSIYTIASVLKNFLRKIPGGVFGREREEQFFSLIKTDNMEQQRDQIHILITSMPIYTQRLLVLLFGTFRVIAANSELAETFMNSEALGVSVAPSFFQSCVSNGKTAKIEDVRRFKIATRIMKFMIDNFGVLNLFGKENYEYYARITGRIINMEEDGFFNFRYPSNTFNLSKQLPLETKKTWLQYECEECGLTFNLENMSRQKESQSTLALVHTSESVKLTASLGMIPENILLESYTRLSVSLEEDGLLQASSRSSSNSSHHSKRAATNMTLDELRAMNRYAESTKTLSYMPQVHERQTARMRTRSEWFLTPIGGRLVTTDSDPSMIHAVRRGSSRSSSGNIAAGLSASADSVKRPSLRKTPSREKQRLHRSSSRRKEKVVRM